VLNQSQQLRLRPAPLERVLRISRRQGTLLCLNPSPPRPRPQIYRMQLLGFNAVRLPFSFKDFNLPGRTDYMQCREASLDEIKRSVTPPGVSPSKPMPSPRTPLTAGGGRCNIGAPSNVFDRFLWAVNYAAKAGMQVRARRLREVWARQAKGSGGGHLGMCL
jgi:hypothetical protein